MQDEGSINELFETYRWRWIWRVGGRLKHAKWITAEVLEGCRDPTCMLRTRMHKDASAFEGY